jgi:hypothetical protein
MSRVSTLRGVHSSVLPVLFERVGEPSLPSCKISEVTLAHTELTLDHNIRASFDKRCVAISQRFGTVRS